MARITAMIDLLQVYKVFFQTGFPHKPVGNLGNSCKFYLGHSQPGIGWEFVKFVQSGWESTHKKCLRLQPFYTKIDALISNIHTESVL